MQELTTFLKEPRNLLMATRLMSHLASGLAHELNNIFTVLLGNITMAKMYVSSNPEKAAAKLDAAEEALLRARTLVGRVHKISIKRPITPGPIPVLAVLRDEAGRSPAAGINWQIAQAFNPAISGSEELFRAAIAEALANACEAAPEKEITIKVRPTAINQQDFLEIAVINQGEMRAEEELAQDFIPYVTTKARQSGLGLTIIRSAMLQHNGFVELTSTPEDGTSLRLLFPMT